MPDHNGNPRDDDHPLYHIKFIIPVAPAPPGYKLIRLPHVASFSLNANRDSEIMEEFVGTTGILRTTLRQDIREQLDASKRDDITILAGQRLVWIRFWSLEDAALFKMFYR
jgi:hypothetical protein